MNGMTPTNKLTPMEEAYLAVKEGMKTDKVDPKQAKKDFDDRDDKDIDNDGDVDSSDKFLHKRRKAIAKKDELDEATQYKKGDKVTVNVAKASDPEMRQLAKEFGDKIGGVVQFQSGSIVSVKTSKGVLNPSVKDVVKESVALDEAFDVDDVDAMCREIESGVKAILVKCEVSKLGLSAGKKPSIFINLSLDDKSDWPNGIWHNSRYGSFVLHGDGNSIELSHKHFSLPKFRKSKYKTTKDIVAKINKWIDSIADA